MIDADHRLWKKPPKENFDEQRRKVLNFAEMWKPYDWTQNISKKVENDSSSSDSDWNNNNFLYELDYVFSKCLSNSDENKASTEKIFSGQILWSTCVMIPWSKEKQWLCWLELMCNIVCAFCVLMDVKNEKRRKISSSLYFSEIY